MRRSAVGWAVGLLLLSSAELARARAPVCLDDLPDELARELWIPLGCEVVDCCRGCPGDLPLELRIRISGEAVAGAEVQLRSGEGPSGEPIRIPRGETVLTTEAIPSAGDPPWVASIRLEPDRAVLDRWRGAATASRGDETLGPVTVDVAQRLGSIVVSELQARWSVRLCLAAAPCDQILQTDNTGGDASAILLDGRRKPWFAGCENDEIHHSSGAAPLGNLLSKGCCRSEVAVFSGQDAMAFEEEVKTWTNSCGDAHTVDLDPILAAPVTFLLAVPDALAKLSWGGKTADVIAKEDLADANQIYDENKTGISFAATWKQLTPAEGLRLLALLPTAIVGALKQGFDPTSFVCSLPSELEQAGFYVPGRLNVYYLPVPGTGMICPDDRNVVFIALMKKQATLAHELGHSLSLLGTWGHTNGVPGFDRRNVMWVGELDVRDHFSLGQAFRQNLEPISSVNVNGVRTGRLRSCPLTAATDQCPRLDLD